MATYPSEQSEHEKPERTPMHPGTRRPTERPDHVPERRPPEREPEHRPEHDKPPRG